MNDITCGLCMDLIPLVRDGIASGDSIEAVERHVKSCAACRALYGGDAPPVINVDRALHKWRRQTRSFSLMLLMFGMFFGLSLTAGAGQFYNTLIMPVIGGLGYVLFRWKALCGVPLLLLLTHSAMNFLRLTAEAEQLDAGSLFVWTALYSVFALTGVLIAGLLHYAFRKEK